MRQHTLILFALVQTVIAPQFAFADSISPGIGEKWQYSEEKPDSEFYGRGPAGRLTEASALRFQGEQDMEDAKFDSAVRKLAKAVQLDPGDPSGHLLYARALSRKIRANDHVTPQEVKIALSEWRLLWHHDADQNEQFEARNEEHRLSRIARSLNKKWKQEAKNAERTVAAGTASVNK